MYYVNLVAIRVAKKVVDIPPAAIAFNPTTGAGTIFDSGTKLHFAIRFGFGLDF